MRRDVFGAPPKELLLENAVSTDPTARWAAAIELGQLGDEDAAKALWKLKIDNDENVRAAADLAINELDRYVLERALKELNLEVASVIDEIETDYSYEDVEQHVAWKIRTLPDPKEESEWAIDAAIINIVTVEGPLTGARLLSLYGRAVFPNAPKKISKFRVKLALERLRKRNIISRSDTSRSDEIETWIIHRAGYPGVLVRTKGLRLLSEIPVNEVKALINQKLFGAAATNKDRQFKVIMEHYEIAPKELYIAGALLEKEWSTLLD